MVKKFADRPFTLFGINSDQSRSALKKVIKKENISWPNIYDEGGTDGEIANRWNVHGWPTIYLIDHQGIIRHRDLHEEELEKAVTELLDKMVEKP